MEILSKGGDLLLSCYMIYILILWSKDHEILQDPIFTMIKFSCYLTLTLYLDIFSSNNDLSAN
jgi:hypothetical protein